MSQEKKRIKRKAERQDWKPHWSLDLLYKIWMAVFTAAKIAVGAVATVLMVCVICGLVFAGLLGDYLQEDILPEADLVLENYDSDKSSFIYCVNEDGEIDLLQNIYGNISFQHADSDEIPQALKDAAVAIEDKRFYEHQGVDWITTVKAFANMFLGDDTIGGSSITQQLIKNVTQDDSVTIQRKVLEFFRASVVEKRYDKDVILEAYLNVIFLGNKCRGVKSAAATYFGKEVKMLNAAECASLIGITNNPSMYDPYSTKVYAFGTDEEEMNGLQRNKYRQEIILAEMHEQGYLTDAEYEEALDYTLVLKDGIDDADRLTVCPNPECEYEDIARNFATESGDFCPQCGSKVDLVVSSSEDVYSWFVDTVLEDVAKDLAARDGVEWNDNTYDVYMDIISRGGYHIYTTLDKSVQAQIDKIYEDLDQIPDTYSAQQLLSAIVVVDNRTGDIVGLAGSVGEKTIFDAFNIATDSKLQSGSSIKPLSVYAPGFELGAISPATVVKDLPILYEDNSPYPKNVDYKYSYSRTVLSAIEDSVNASAASTLQMIGTGYSFDFAKNKFGLSTLVERYTDSYGIEHSDVGIGPLALGAQTLGVSLRDMTAAFATFANNGTYREARTYTKVYDSEGTLILDNPQASETILSEKTVKYINYCLVQAAKYGTGAGANFYTTEIAGKTGSTSSFRDRWFCGYTSYYTAAVWMGYEIPEAIRVIGNTGSYSAGMWRKVLEPLHAGKKWKDLYTTYGMRNVEVCLDSGKLATDACKNDIRAKELSRVDSAYAYWEDVTHDYCDKHVELEFCTTGGGVATEYCKHFAEVDSAVKIETKGLVKMTQEEIDEIMKAKKHGLDENFFRDEYIYLVDKNGKDLNFKGLNKNINKDVNAPYLVCPVHTKEAWEAYQAQQPTEPSAPVDPTNPSDPTDATVKPPVLQQ